MTPSLVSVVFLVPALGRSIGPVKSLLVSFITVLQITVTTSDVNKAKGHSPQGHQGQGQGRHFVASGQGLTSLVTTLCEKLPNLVQLSRSATFESSKNSSIIICYVYLPILNNNNNNTMNIHIHLRLRSSDVATRDVPRTRTTLGDQSFTAAGPHLWNNLPLHLRDFELSLSGFRRLLKTHLFG